MPDFTPLELDILRLLGARAAWLDLDHVIAELEALDGGSPHDRTRVLASLSYLTRAGYAVRSRRELRDPLAYRLTARGAAELAARDQLRLTA